MLQDPLVVYDPICALLSGGQRSHKIRVGVWRCFHFNFKREIKGDLDEYSNKLDVPGGPGPYGVCDSEQQFLKKFGPFLEALDGKFCVSLTTVLKRAQSKEGGWRWHKWGPYFGNKDPKCEYLYDEGDDITEACVFHVFELL